MSKIRVVVDIQVDDKEVAEQGWTIEQVLDCITTRDDDAIDGVKIVRAAIGDVRSVDWRTFAEGAPTLVSKEIVSPQIDVWIIDETRLGEGFHVNVMDRETDEQMTKLVAYGLATEELAKGHIELLKSKYDVNVLSQEIL